MTSPFKTGRSFEHLMRFVWLAEATPDMMPVLRHGPAVAHILDTAMAASGRKCTFKSDFKTENFQKAVFSCLLKR